MDYQIVIDDIVKNNEFSKNIGIEIVEVSEGYAKAQIRMTEKHRNPFGTIHGGCLFSLADVTGGCAAASYGMRVVTADADFHFLRPGFGCENIFGTARELKAGKHLMVYSVEISDDKGAILASGTFTYMKLDMPLRPITEE